jgi:hypothetical protein
MGCLVKLGSQVWEVWSPNLQATLFLPGLAASPLEHYSNWAPDCQHFDSHLGWFNHTFSPQQLTPLAPWKGYILCSVLSSEEQPEF